VKLAIEEGERRIAEIEAGDLQAPAWSVRRALARKQPMI
jgi:hypothetical protein